jgi:hypothetical protein
MSKKKGGFNGKAGKWQGDSEYATVVISKDDEKPFQDWLLAQKDDFSSAIQRVSDDLYRVSLKADVNNDCFMCTFTQQDEKHHNSGLIISSRSDEIEESFWLNVYKVYVMHEGERLPTDTQDRSWG